MEIVKKDKATNRIYIDIEDVGLQWAVELSDETNVIENLLKHISAELRIILSDKISKITTDKPKKGDNPCIEEL